jgi:hypothetical protein
MKPAAIDTGALVASVFWRHEPHLCLNAKARGFVLPVMGEEILAEYRPSLRASFEARIYTTRWRVKGV